MEEERQIAPVTEPVHLSFSEQRQPFLRGERRHYLLARGDQLAFAAEVVRFGFAPDDFALDVERIRGNNALASGLATFAVRVENVHNGRAATYLGGPGRAWVAEFLVALITGDFGQP
jgi:hypothetical protein